MNYFNLIYEYLEKKPSLQCIPVKDKAPFISSWQSIEVTREVVETWEEQYLGTANGFGVRAGQYNIGWMDIDTDDIEQIYRIDETMNLSQICVKKGKKGKTVFFRFEGTPKKSKYNVYLRSGDKKPVVEFNFTSGQTVLPPSIHPETGAPYVWVTNSLLDLDIDELPIIDEAKIEYLETILRASSFQEGLKEVPTSITGDGTGKWKTITSEAARLLHMGIDESTIARTLVGLDRQLFGMDQFFFSKKIGKDLISKDNDIENAMMWIGTFKQSLMRSDPDLRATLTSVVRVKESAPIYGDWDIIKPLLSSKQAVEYPEHLFPSSCKEYCYQLSKLSAMPPEAFLGAIFTTFAVVSQGIVHIHAKRDFVVHPTVSTLIIAPSGSRKDTIFQGARAPLKKLVERDSAKIDNNFVEREKDICSKIEDLERKKKKAISENDDVTNKALTEEKIVLQNELLTIKQMRPSFLFEGGTQEKLYKLMMENQDRGIFLCNPEFVQLMGNINKLGNESMRGFILKLLNGSVNETHSHQTLSGLNADIKRVFGSSLVGVQTDTFGHEIRKMESGAVNDGLFQRYFLINVSPEIRMMEDLDHDIESSKIDNMFALLYDHKKHIHVEWENDEAKRAYFEYDFKLRQDSQYDSSAIRSFRSKYSGQSVKIAWIFAQLDNKPGHIVTKLSKKYFLMAVEWLQWQSRCLDVTWSNNNYSSALRVADNILAGIGSGMIKPNTFYADVNRSMKHSPLEIKSGIDMLVDNNYIRRVSDKVEFNPIL